MLSADRVIPALFVFLELCISKKKIHACVVDVHRRTLVLQQVEDILGVDLEIESVPRQRFHRIRHPFVLLGSCLVPPFIIRFDVRRVSRKSLLYQGDRSAGLVSNLVQQHDFAAHSLGQGTEKDSRILNNHPRGRRCVGVDLGLLLWIAQVVVVLWVTVAEK
jgi:hypothetical protein